MSGAFGLAGFYFGRKPTSASSEAEVSVANSSMPWEVEHDDHEDESKHFKYQYHPKGDRSQTPRNAPSALNTVIVPNVTLPKVCNYSSNHPPTDLILHTRSYMTNSTNGARKDTEQRMPALVMIYIHPQTKDRARKTEVLQIAEQSCTYLWDRQASIDTCALDHLPEVFLMIAL